MNNDKVALVRVDMGEPILETQKIPVNSESDRFIAQPVEMDAMHRREGYDSDAMYDVTRNIMLGQGVPIPYPGKYWTAEVFLDGCDQYSTAYMFSAEL